jgi:hypothetical protein
MFMVRLPSVGRLAADDGAKPGVPVPPRIDGQMIETLPRRRVVAFGVNKSPNY